MATLEDQPVKVPGGLDRLKRDQLLELVKEATQKAVQLNKLYRKFLEAPEGQQSLVVEIEGKLQAIADEYSQLFLEDVSGSSKVMELKNKIDEIKKYHQDLLDGENSVKADIEDSQKHITDFYNRLFGDGGQEKKVTDAIKTITDFDGKLSEEGGYSDSIEKTVEEIIEAHSDLFSKRDNSLSKVEELNDNISSIKDFEEKIRSEIDPLIKDKVKAIQKINSDIATKQNEVNALLSKAEAKSLAQGYLESMQLYGAPITRFDGQGYKGLSLSWRWIVYAIVAILRSLKYALKIFGGYLLFVGPLVVIGLVFVQPEVLKNILGLSELGNVKFSGSEYIAYKLTVALPLLWVSWYGQKSISHRKRLFEEYNHKLRVVHMYLLFVSKETERSYTLDKETRKDLEKTLMNVINRNPSEVYGRDETMLDKLMELIQSYKKDSKSEVSGANQNA